MVRYHMFADMAELADALDLGSSVNRRAGSTPVIRTIEGRIVGFVLFLTIIVKGANMAVFTLENDILKVSVASKGCEITDVYCKADGTHRMWDANPDGWKRVAPVLFPLIGKYKDNKCVYNGSTYEMSQHGFARDMEFEIVETSAERLVMRLTDNNETKVKYPFNFVLELEYALFGNEITETYRVINTDNKSIHFSIGGHPAFITPQHDRSMSGCKIRFNSDTIRYRLLSEDGLLERKEYELPLIDCEYSIQADTFEKDALIIEGGQASEVSLIKDDKEFVTVQFEAPVFGLWSCKGRNVPFVCIEPWYGRTDAEDFTGELADREYSNHLNPGEKFEKSFKIIFK